MHSMLRLGAAALLALGAATAAPASGSTPAGSPGGAAAGAARAVAPPGPTERIAGPQHWCGSNGYNCADPAGNWDELSGFAQAKAHGARLSRYIGHDEPMTQFFSSRPGSAGDVSYVIRLPKDPPTRPR